ncbi:MAG: hypothetical protein IPK81_21620 [Rhodospirillales bacterium]|nr:MAG: hypothetical protein IPK81_21620 [Rhodospirillales bacterium]
MARVLIGCEAEAPAGALIDAVVLGARLEAAGHAVTYAAADPAGLAQLAGGAIATPILPAPSVLYAASARARAAVVGGLGDLMALAGYESAPRLIALARSWAALLDLAAPDVVVGLDAPVLWLAAAARRPTMAVGDRFTLPPVEVATRVRLSPDLPPVASIADMLANANAALDAIGGAKLAALDDILGRCAVVVHGPAQLDPYLALRGGLPSSTIGAAPAAAFPPVRGALAAALDARCPEIDNVVVALCGLGDIRIDAFVAGGSATMDRFLAATPGLRAHGDVASWLAALPGTGAVLHHGVGAIAARALIGGLPQLVLPWRSGQRLVGETLVALGCGVVEGPGAPVEQLVETFRGIAGDGARYVAARHHAERVALAPPVDAADAVVAEVARLAMAAR